MSVDQHKPKSSLFRLLLLVILAALLVFWIVAPSYHEMRFANAFTENDVDYLNQVYGFPTSVRFISSEKSADGNMRRAMREGALQFAVNADGNLSLLFSGEGGDDLNMPLPGRWAKDYPTSAYLLGYRTLTLSESNWYLLPDHVVHIDRHGVHVTWLKTSNKTPQPMR